MVTLTEWKKQRKDKARKQKWAMFRLKAFLVIAILGYGYHYFFGFTVPQFSMPSFSMASITEYITKDNKDISLSKSKWTEDQKQNLLTVQKVAKEMNHPDTKRIVAHLLNESNAKTVADGDIGNGFGKKSYGPMQVKLGTVYYNKSKRPDLFNAFAPEVNTLAKEDVLHKLRKDPEFNAKMGVITHLVLIDVCGDMNRASVAYNRGKCEADNKGREYLNNIFQNEKRI